jgi:hypothetical protein
MTQPIKRRKNLQAITGARNGIDENEQRPVEAGAKRKPAGPTYRKPQSVLGCIHAGPSCSMGRAWSGDDVSPEAFFATCARLLPRDVAISIQAQAPILDAGDLAILRAIREASGDRQLAGQHSVALSRSIGRRFCGRYSGWASAFTIAVIVIVLGIGFLVYYLR